MYGFVADLSLSVPHNVTNILSSMPLSLLYSLPSKLSCHNLCTTLQPPSGFKFLLGLGLNFCIADRRTTNHHATDTAIARFRKDFYTGIFFTQDVDDDDNADTFTPGQLFSVATGNPTPTKSRLKFELEPAISFVASEKHSVPNEVRLT